MSVVCAYCSIVLGNEQSYIMHRTGSPDGECVHPNDLDHWQNDEGWDEDALGVWHFHQWTDEEIARANDADAQRRAAGLDDDEYEARLLDSTLALT